MISIRTSIAPILAAMIAACGGNVVVDQPGSSGGTTRPTGAGGFGGYGGMGGVGGGGGAGGFGAVGGAGGCDALYAGFKSRLEAAQACDPTINALQCTGMTVVSDGCGCAVVASDFHGAEAMNAVAAFNQWVDAGCGPYECFACPPPPPSPWYCDSSAKKCMPAWEK